MVQSKPFDTVDKSLLKQKLIKLGFCEDSIMLITSDLEPGRDRDQDDFKNPAGTGIRVISAEIPGF